MTPTNSYLLPGSPPIELNPRYADRISAGHQLGQLLLPYREGHSLVLALPPGGVVIAGEVARLLRLPLDVLLVRKITLRAYPALIAGALSEYGGLCLNRAVLRLPKASLESFWREADLAARDLAAQHQRYRGGRGLPPLHRRQVILVDDGIGSGVSQLVALQTLRRLHARRCIIATPHASPSVIAQLRSHADRIVVLDSNPQPEPYWQQQIDDQYAALLLGSYQHAKTV